MTDVPTISVRLEGIAHYIRDSVADHAAEIQAAVNKVVAEADLESLVREAVGKHIYLYVDQKTRETLYEIEDPLGKSRQLIASEIAAALHKLMKEQSK